MYDLSNNKIKIKSLVNVINISYPFILFIIEFLLSYLKLNKYLINVIIILLSIILIIPLFIKIRSRIKKAFYKMEVN